VYSLFDKIAGQEVFYKNSVIRFSPLAIRGAFFSGGLEFSFPVAHAPTTASPVNWELTEQADGSASIHIGGIEHMSGLRWTVSLSLFPDRCAVAQDVRLSNPTPLPGRYHYWTNASLASDVGTEFIYPLRRVRSYEFAGTASWPIARLDLIAGQPGLPGMEGVPMWPAGRMHTPVSFRWEKDMLAQVSIFGREVAADFFGAWQHSHNVGYAHFADSADVAGMKLWSWVRPRSALSTRPRSRTTARCTPRLSVGQWRPNSISSSCLRAEHGPGANGGCRCADWMGSRVPPPRPAPAWPCFQATASSWTYSSGFAPFVRWMISRRRSGFPRKR